MLFGMAVCSKDSRAALAVTAVGTDPPRAGLVAAAGVEQPNGTLTNGFSSGPGPLGSKPLLLGGAVFKPGTYRVRAALASCGSECPTAPTGMNDFAAYLADLQRKAGSNTCAIT